MRVGITLYRVIAGLLLMGSIETILVKAVPTLTKNETMVIGFVVILYVFMPIISEIFIREKYKVVNIVRYPDRGWVASGIENRFFPNESAILEHFSREGWRVKNISVVESDIGNERERRIYYLYKN